MLTFSRFAQIFLRESAVIVVIGNAGTDNHILNFFNDQPVFHIALMIKLNIEATLRITHEILNRRNDQGKFYLVFVASLASLYPMPLKATYAASKRFLYDFSIALGEELKAKHVSVLSLCPGGLPTTEEAIRCIQVQGF